MGLGCEEKKVGLLLIITEKMSKMSKIRVNFTIIGTPGVKLSAKPKLGFFHLVWMGKDHIQELSC